jgi:hypothetical protein
MTCIRRATDDIFIRRTTDDIFIRATGDIFIRRATDDIFIKRATDDIFIRRGTDDIFIRRATDNIFIRRVKKTDCSNYRGMSLLSSTYKILSNSITCWITTATNAHSKYAIRIALPRQQWVDERISLLRYTYIA